MAGQFAYEGQTAGGQPVRGTIEGVSLEDAQARLQMMGVIVGNVNATQAATVKTTRRALGADDFQVFNQQLAHLTAAGLPVEKGLRLIAADIGSGRLAGAAREVAAELERGTPLDQAFARHAQRFPRLYGQLIGAGVKSGNLPAILFNLGRHLELVSRLRAALWQAVAYPCMVMLLMFAVASLIILKILPMLRDVFRGFRTTLPLLTEILLWIGEQGPYILGGLAVLVLAGVILWMVCKLSRAGVALEEAIVLLIPLVGPVIRRSLLARWCDALRVAVEAGLDLPTALDMAGNVVGSPRLQDEGNALIAWLAAGRTFDDYPSGYLIPATIPAAIELGSKTGDLPSTLAMLTRMYQIQAEHRLRTIPVILVPLLLVFMAVCLSVLISGTFLPLIKLVQSVSGGEDGR